MSLVNNFNNVKSSSTLKLSELQVNIRYNVLKSKKVETKYGETICLELQLNEQSTAWVFLPKRYVGVFTNSEIENINKGQNKIALEFHGVCKNTKAYQLTLHSQ